MKRVTAILLLLCACGPKRPLLVAPEPIDPCRVPGGGSAPDFCHPWAPPPPPPPPELPPPPAVPPRLLELPEVAVCPAPAAGLPGEPKPDAETLATLLSQPWCLDADNVWEFHRDGTVRGGTIDAYRGSATSTGGNCWALSGKELFFKRGTSSTWEGSTIYLWNATRIRLRDRFYNVCPPKKPSDGNLPIPC